MLYLSNNKIYSNYISSYLIINFVVIDDYDYFF